MMGSQVQTLWKKPFSWHKRQEKYVPKEVSVSTNSSQTTMLFYRVCPHQSEQRTQRQDLTFTDTQIERALGIQWSIEGDSFRFNNTLADQGHVEAYCLLSPPYMILLVFWRHMSFPGRTCKICAVKVSDGRTLYLKC